jgi:uncharacterized protein
MPLSSHKCLAFASLFALAPLQAFPALAHDEPDRRTISLSASGAVKTTPDQVDISTGVSTEAKTAREALDGNTEAMSKIIEALKAEGIDAKDIQTVNFSVGPVYDNRPMDKPTPPEVVGYRVTNQVRITLHDIKKLGGILDKVVSLGSNQIDSIEFGVDEPEALKDEARKLAVKNVTDDAKIYAEAAGVSLGQIVSIAEEESSYQPRYAPMAASMDSAKAVPIEAGTASVEVRVRITWELN